MKRSDNRFTVIDLFSGAGGMSYGFHANSAFRIIGAADVQVGKPSSGKGSLECNETYYENMGLRPVEADLSEINPSDLHAQIYGNAARRKLSVLIACAPCTGFSRTTPNNHLRDDPRNSLVLRTSLFVEEFKPDVFLMENARELIQGNFSHHFDRLRERLQELGYQVKGEVHRLNRFGLPQIRERAFVIATKKGLPIYGLDDLWGGFCVTTESQTVRRAIEHFPTVDAGETHPEDKYHRSPSFADPNSLKRLQMIPKDGGSWVDLLKIKDGIELMTPAMKRYVEQNKFGSHPDVYGRLWWDRPCVTIKRECAHVGNGRYAHPEQDRLCTVREMATLQGFPEDYSFNSSGLANMYRHIGDAVPPLIAFQISKLCEWILTGKRPDLDSCVLPKTSLKADDIQPIRAKQDRQLSIFA